MASYRETEANLPNREKGKVPMSTVLVVDDEWDIRELLSDIISDLGLKVIQAENGETALKCARTDLPDLILLDVWMPGFDGFQVLEKLRENQITRYIPVVLLTAMPAFQGEQEGLDSGATHYIHKPWEAGVVEATVRVVLRQSAALKGGSEAGVLDSSDDASDNREDGSKPPEEAEERVVELPVDTKNVDVKTPEVRIYQEPKAGWLEVRAKTPTRGGWTGGQNPHRRPLDLPRAKNGWGAGGGRHWVGQECPLRAPDLRSSSRRF
jgi:DNA-binding response OmpR family regulator